MMNTPVSEVGATRSVSQNPLGENDRKFLGSRHRWGTEKSRPAPAATASAGACFLQSRVMRRRDVDWLLTEPPAFKSAFGVLWGGLIGLVDPKVNQLIFGQIK